MHMEPDTRLGKQRITLRGEQARDAWIADRMAHIHGWTTSL